MPAPKDHFRLNEFLPYRLVNTAERASQALSALYSRQFDLTIPEWRIVATLGTGDSLTAKELGERTQMSKVTVSRATARLMSKHYLLKKGDPQDGRVTYLRLSDKGRAAYEKLVPLVMDWENQLTDDLSSAELEQLHTLLSKLQNRLSRM